MNASEAKRIAALSVQDAKEAKQREFINGPGADVLEKIRQAAIAGHSNVIVPYSQVEHDGLVLLDYSITVRDSSTMKVNW